MKKSIQYIIVAITSFFYLQTGIAIAAYAFQQKEPILGENLLLNPGFEKDRENWTMPGNAKVVNDMGYKSNSSLHIKNLDASKSYSGVSQKLYVGPGETVYFKVQVKGKNLMTSDAQNKKDGARIYIQSYDEFGKIVGGRYPPSTGTGTFDWKELSGEYTIPLNAASVSIGISFIKGVTGEAWFDEVSLKVESSPLYQSFLVTPNYRGLVLKNDVADWVTKVQITPSHETKIASKALMVYEFKDVKGKILAKKTYQTDFSKKDTLLHFTPPKGLKEGDYSLLMKYYDDKGKLFIEQNHVIEVVSQMPPVYIDKDGFTIKDGKKIFPFGLYIGFPEDEHLSRIKEAGFNTILSYGYGHNKKYNEYLDKAEQYGLNVIYSLKDLYPGRSGAVKVANPREMALEYINNIKHKPALLAWYIVDELLPEWLPKIETMYNDVKKNDTDHPALQVHYFEGAKMIEKYYYTTDIMATDPYPVGRNDLTLTTVRTDAGVKGTHNGRAVWSVPQIMDWAVYIKDRKPKPPTLDEMRNQTYQALIGGAKGLLYYTYYDLFQVQYPRKPELDYENFNKIWKDVRAMSQETQEVIPLILEGKDSRIDILNNEGIVAKAIEFNNALYIMLANPYYTVRNVSVNLPAGWKSSSENQGQIQGAQSGSLINFVIPAIGSGIYKLIKE